MRLTLLLVLAVIVAALALTNPDRDRFEEFVDGTVATIIHREAADQPWSGIVGDLGGALAARLARRATDRSNYLVVSVYTIDMGSVGMRDEEWVFLGIANTFIELERPERLR